MRLLLSSALFFSSAAFAAPKNALITVPVHYMEALAPKDTTSSTRYQNDYESILQMGKNLTTDKLKKCGYAIQESVAFYEASDPLQAKEKAAAADASGVWLIAGPRRSNHYVLTAQGAPKTPSVSLMAGSNEVFSLGPLHLTLGIPNSQLGAKAAKIAKRFATTSGNYVAIVSEDCLTCVDFERNFKAAALKLGIKELSIINITGEDPNLENIISEIKKIKRPISFFLTPNFSKVTGILIAGLHKIFPKPIYIGGDGWGSDRYGFLHNTVALEDALGYSVTSFTPKEDSLKTFGLGREVIRNKTLFNEFPSGGTGLALLKISDGLAELLCKAKPKNKTEFAEAFKKYGGKLFYPDWGVGALKLSNTQLIFDKGASR